MKLSEILITFTLLGVTTAPAQLHASRLELVARFGDPLGEDIDPQFGTLRCTFHQSPWTIQAWLLHGSCQMISYQSSSRPRPTDENLTTLLERNAAGYRWLAAGQMMQSASGDAPPRTQLHLPRSDYGAYLVRLHNGLVFKTDHWKGLEDRAQPISLPRPPLRFEKVTQAPIFQTRPRFQERAAPQSLSRPPIRRQPASTKTSTTRPSEAAQALIRTALRNSAAHTTRPTSPSTVRSHPVIVVLVMALLMFAVVLPRLFRSPQAKGWLGEKLTFFLVLKRLDPASYRIFNDIYLPRPDGVGSTQIDHVVVSPFGIFVIETKNWGGWIYGTEHQREWTQVFFRKRFSMENPLHQNRLHIRALSQFLNLPSSTCHSLVFLMGQCEIKTDLPRNVLTSGLRRYIKSHHTPILSHDLANRSVAELEIWVRSREHANLRRGHCAFLKTFHKAA